jgi:hypothetical protein
MRGMKRRGFVNHELLFVLFIAAMVIAVAYPFLEAAGFSWPICAIGSMGSVVVVIATMSYLLNRRNRE